MADDTLTVKQEIAGLKRQVQSLKKALASLIAWTAGSANSPIRRDEATELLNMLEPDDPR